MTAHKPLTASLSMYVGNLDFAPYPDYQTGVTPPLLIEQNSAIQGRGAMMRCGANYLVLSEALLRALPLEIESLLRKWDDDDNEKAIEQTLEEGIQRSMDERAEMTVDEMLGREVG